MMIRKASWGLVLLILLFAACMGTGPNPAEVSDLSGVEPGVVYVYKPAT